MGSDGASIARCEKTGRCAASRSQPVGVSPPAALPAVLGPGFVVIAELAGSAQVVPIERQIWQARRGLLLVHHGGAARADALVLDPAEVAVSVQDLRDQLSPSALTSDPTGSCAWTAPCLRVLRAVAGEADQVRASGHWARPRSSRHWPSPPRAGTALDSVCPWATASRRSATLIRRPKKLRRWPNRFVAGSSPKAWLLAISRTACSTGWGSQDPLSQWQALVLTQMLPAWHSRTNQRNMKRRSAKWRPGSGRSFCGDCTDGASTDSSVTRMLRLAVGPQSGPQGCPSHARSQ